MARGEVGGSRSEFAGIALAERDAQCLLEPHRCGEREGTASGQRLFEGRDAEFGLIGQVLPGHPPARQLLANDRGDQAALLGRELLFGLVHRQPQQRPAQFLTYPHKP